MAQVGFMKGLIIKKTYERLLFIDYHILSSYMCSGNEGSLFQVLRETATATKTSLRCYKLYRAFFILFNSLNVSQRFWT